MSHRTEFPRLHTDEPDPPAPLPFRADAAPGRVDDTSGDRAADRAPDRAADRTDTARRTEAALDRAQRALDELALLADELEADSLPFPGRNPDDDGPPAAA